MKINKESWHYRLAKIGYEDLPLYERMDLCAYSRKVFRGCICIALLAALAGAVCWAVGDFLGWVAAMAVAWKWINADVPAGFVLMTLVLLLAVFCIATLHRWLHKREVLPPIVREAYKGWKEKYCPMLELGDTESPLR